MSAHPDTRTSLPGAVPRRTQHIHSELTSCEFPARTHANCADNVAFSGACRTQTSASHRTVGGAASAFTGRTAGACSAVPDACAAVRQQMPCGACWDARQTGVDFARGRLLLGLCHLNDRLYAPGRTRHQRRTAIGAEKISSISTDFMGGARSNSRRARVAPRTRGRLPRSLAGTRGGTLATVPRHLAARTPLPPRTSSADYLAARLCLRPRSPTSRARTPPPWTSPNQTAGSMHQAACTPRISARSGEKKVGADRPIS